MAEENSVESMKIGDAETIRAEQKAAEGLKTSHTLIRNEPPTL